MSPLLSPTTVPKHPIRHLHERAQQDGKLLKFVCSVSNPRTEGISPMEEAEQKRKNGEIPTNITPEQAAKDAAQVSNSCVSMSGTVFSSALHASQYHIDVLPPSSSSSSLSSSPLLTKQHGCGLLSG